MLESNRPAIKSYLLNVWDGLVADAQAKGQKMPLQFRLESAADAELLWTAGHLKYLILGRGPGKQPPPAEMEAMVKKNPDMLQDARKTWRYITEKGLAFIIGRSIGLRGTAIFQGKKPGLDLLGVMETNMPDLLEVLAKNEAMDIITALRSELK
jgi:hypothetical protein